VTAPRQRNVEIAVGITLLVIAGYLGWDILRLSNLHAEQGQKLQAEHASLVHQVSCNNNLIIVLRKRSDARIAVDLATMRAQESLVALLSDLNEQQGYLSSNDAHLLEARDAFEKASLTRANPDLWLPYPSCAE
jgi:hypothetical protein